MIDLIIEYSRTHLLTVVTIVVTVLLYYYFVLDRSPGAKLSRKYRESIYETQSKIFLNATQHLISGDRNKAIKEFLSIAEVNKEALDVYFTLGGLFRTNGEVDKAINIHRSVIARQNINDETRIKALKELALDFDRGGFIDQAEKSYKEILRIDREDKKVVIALCRIYESLGDWDQAIKYRKHLSKITNVSQEKTISKIYGEMALQRLEENKILEALEFINLSLQHAPNASVKIIEVIVTLFEGNLRRAKSLFAEVFNQYPEKRELLFNYFFQQTKRFGEKNTLFFQYSEKLKDYLFEITPIDDVGPIFAETKMKYLIDSSRFDKVEKLINKIIDYDQVPQNLLIQFLDFSVKQDNKNLIAKVSKKLQATQQHQEYSVQCRLCGHHSTEIFWRCPQCNEWDTVVSEEKVYG